MEYLFIEDFNAFYQTKKEILIYENTLSKYEIENERHENYAQFVKRTSEEEKKTWFTISELTGEGNYPPLKEWSYQNLIDYIVLKNEKTRKDNARNKS